MWRVLTVAEKLRVGWLFKEEDLDLSIWERERETERCVHEKVIGVRNWWGRAWDREGRRGCLRRNERDVLQKLVHVNQQDDWGGRDLHFSGALMRKDKPVLFSCSILPLTEQGSARSSTTRRPSRLDMGAPRSRGSVSPLYYKIKFEGQHVSILTCCAEI